MKHLNQQSKKIMDKLVEGITLDNAHRRIDNSQGAFMAVVIEYLREISLGGTQCPVFSVTHYYEQNGDAMRDPDMEFFRGADGNYYPIYFRQDGRLPIEQEVFICDENGQIKQYRPKLMSDLSKFGNTWMKNIQEQQGI